MSDNDTCKSCGGAALEDGYCSKCDYYGVSDVHRAGQEIADLRQLIADLLPHVDFVKPSPVWLKRYYRPSCQLCGVKRDDNGDWLHAPTCAYDRADKIRKGER